MLDPADGWWDFIEGNALEIAGERNKAAALYLRALRRKAGDSWRVRFALANLLATSGYDKMIYAPMIKCLAGYVPQLSPERRM